MIQARYGDGSTGGRRIVDLPEPIDKAFGVPSFSALKTSVKTVGAGNTAGAMGSMLKPKIASGLGTLTKTPGRTAATIGGSLVAGNLAGRRTGRNQVYNAFGKADIEKIDVKRARKLQHVFANRGDRALYVRAHNVTNQAERRQLWGPQANQKISAARSRADMEDSRRMGLHRAGRKRGIDLVDPANAKAYRLGEPYAKAYIPEERRQRRLGMYEAGLGLGGAALVVRGGQGARKTARALMNGMPPHKDLRGVVAANRGQQAQIGGGVAALGGAGLVRQHAEGKRNRRWS